jgi:hypothetical protein
MTADDKQFARKLSAYLDRSNAGLKAGTVYRLQQARARALAQLAETAPARDVTLAGAHSLAGGGTAAGRHGRRGHPWWANRALWIGIALIIAGGIFYTEWEAAQQMQEIAETDAAILSSDLPIDAYLDRGFQIWLKHDGDH